MSLWGQRFKLGLFIYSSVEMIGLLFAASLSFTPAQPSPTVSPPQPSPTVSPPPTTKPSPPSTPDSDTWLEKFWERYLRRSR